MGPLVGYTVIELAGIGPCPMAGMMLGDMGARVIRVDRQSKNKSQNYNDISARNKESIIINLKQPQGRAAFMALVKQADVLIEGFRPGVMEKLGIGPEQCQAINPALIYGRMTGWGQDGPLAQRAGHDINYIALTGALHAIGRRDQAPVPPLNLVGDFGGGTLFLVVGVLAALLERQQSGKGQVIDAAMVDGVANLMWICHSLAAANRWDPEHREANIIDGGAFFYGTYETKDGKYIAVGAIESQFLQEFVAKAQLDPQLFNAEQQMDRSRWPDLKQQLRDHIKTKTQQQWLQIFADGDACVAPVLSFMEAPQHPHLQARHTYQSIDGIVQPSPAPRFSRTVSEIRHSQHPQGQDSKNILRELGYSETDIDTLFGSGDVA